MRIKNCALEIKQFWSHWNGSVWFSDQLLIHYVWRQNWSKSRCRKKLSNSLYLELNSTSISGRFRVYPRMILRSRQLSLERSTFRFDVNLISTLILCQIKLCQSIEHRDLLRFISSRWKNIHLDSTHLSDKFLRKYLCIYRSSINSWFPV